MTERQRIAEEKVHKSKKLVLDTGLLRGSP